MKYRAVIGVALAFVLSVIAARAEVVELRNGQRVEGKLRRATPDSVTIEVGQQTLTFKAAEVRAIYYGSAPTPLTRREGGGVSATEALRALKALRSVVELGVSFRDYGPRLADTKIKVDEFMESAPANAMTVAIHSALFNYQFAQRFWGIRIETNNDVRFRVIEPLASVEGCREMREVVADLKSREYHPDTFMSDDIQERLVPILWRCASRNIADAERLMKR